MADETSPGLLARLLTETWPAKAGRGLLDAVMLPGQVAGGILNVPPSRPGYWSDAGMESGTSSNNHTSPRQATNRLHFSDMMYR